MSAISGHIQDPLAGIALPRETSELPAVHLGAAQIDVGNQGSRKRCHAEQLERPLARCGAQDTQHLPQKIFVLDRKDHRPLCSVLGVAQVP